MATAPADSAAKCSRWGKMIVAVGFELTSDAMIVTGSW
jgi:hypothetical protein